LLLFLLEIDAGQHRVDEPGGVLRARLHAKPVSLDAPEQLLAGLTWTERSIDELGLAQDFDELLLSAFGLGQLPHLFLRGIVNRFHRDARLYYQRIYGGLSRRDFNTCSF
jgi:hypothetical protein